MTQKKIFCPFCKKEVTEDTEPTEIKTAIGTSYICYKKICRNIPGHVNHTVVVIPYKK